MEISKALLQSTNYREFLKDYIAIRKANERSFNLNKFCKESNISTPSYPVDIISGRRRLTASVLPKILAGLKLSNDEKEYFKFLVIQEEPDLNSEKTPDNLIRNKLENLKARITTRLIEKANQLNDPWPFEDNKSPRILAAIGTSQKGRTLNEILKMTGFEVQYTHEVIQLLLENDIISECSASRYKMCEQQLHLEQLNQSPKFKKYYKNALIETANLSNKSISEVEDRFFLSSMMPIKKENLPLFREKLKSLICTYMDEIEDENADEVAILNLGFYTQNQANQK